MKRTLLTLASLTLFGHAAWAADVFVMKAVGPNLSDDQSSEVTDMVRRAVRRMPEHSLVTTQTQADFVLRPSIVQRGDQQVLRIEKLKNGDVLALAEESLNSVNASRDQAFAATETAMQDDRLASGTDKMHDASDVNNTASNIDTRGIVANPTADVSMPGRDATTESGSSTGSSDSGFSSSDSANSAAANSAVGTNNNAAAAGADLRAPSPAIAHGDVPGTFEFGLGPAFGLGLKSDQLMYDINIGYHYPINERFSAKGFGDLNLTTGADAARFLNFGIGGEMYPVTATLYGARPYVDADLGYAFTRSNNGTTADAPAIGAGAGFRFAANELNVDINLHYTYLTSVINDDHPSVLGIRAALNF